METTPGDRQGGYDNEAEERAYSEQEDVPAGDQDAGPASTPDEPQPDQAEG